MFINSKKTYEFPHPDGLGKATTIPAEFLGPVADWITETPLFALAVKEGSITIAEHETIIPAVSAEELELRQRANTLGIEHANELSLIGLAVLVYQAENAMDDEDGGDDPPADDSAAPGNTANIANQLEAMDENALRDYAEKNNISLGSATSENGMRKKILDALN